MPSVTFNKNKSHLANLSLEVSSEENLMFKLLEQGLPVASSCKGDGVCGKCRITVLEGMENISLETAVEKTLKVKNKLKPNERISCQLKVNGPIKIDTNYW